MTGDFDRTSKICAVIGWCADTTAMIAVPHVRSTRALDPLVGAVVVEGKAVQCAFFPCGIVSMMERIATATINTLNMSAIIAAARIATLSWRP